MPVQAGPRTLLAATCLAIIAAYLTSLAVPPLIPVFVDDVGLSYSEAGGLMSAFTFAFAVGSLVAGKLADSADVLRLMAAGVALCCVAGALLSATSDVALLLILRGGVGAGLAFVFTPGIRLAASLFPGRANVGVGWVLASVNIGVAATFLVTPLLEEAASWQWVFRAYAGVALIVALGLLVLRSPKARLVRAAAEPPAARVLLRNPRVLATAACLFVTMFMIYAVLTWFPPFLSDEGDYGSASVALASTLMAIASIPASILAGIVVDRSGRALGVATFGLALALPVVGLALVAPSAYAILVLIAVVAVVGPSVGLVGLYALPPRAAGPEAAGQVTGIGNFCAYPGAIVATYVGGWIVDAGGYGIAFVFFACVAALGALVVLPLAARPFADLPRIECRSGRAVADQVDTQ